MIMIGVLFNLILSCSGFFAVYELVGSLFSMSPTSNSFIIFGRILIQIVAGGVGYFVCLIALVLIEQFIVTLLKALFK